MILNKDKSIGNVIFIAEGEKTEIYLLKLIFGKILGYQLESLTRRLKYKKYNERTNSTSKVFIINSEESNIKFADECDLYLDSIFAQLRYKYEFDVENSAIYFVFDRDNESNNDKALVRRLIGRLKNSRENDDYDEAGLLLLSYPCIEAYTLDNFFSNSLKDTFEKSKELKQYLHKKNINHQNINEETIIKATGLMLKKLEAHGEFNIDALLPLFSCLFEEQEALYDIKQVYRAVSTLSVALIDLGIIEEG